MYLKGANNDTEAGSSAPKTPLFWRLLRWLFPVYDDWRQLRQPSTRWDLRSPGDTKIWFDAANIWLKVRLIPQEEISNNLSLPGRSFQGYQKKYQSILQALATLHTFMLLSTSIIYSLIFLAWLVSVTIRILALFHVEVPVFIARIVQRSLLIL